MRNTSRAALLVATFSIATLLASHRPALAIVVFDPSNFAENVLQAARALQQIDNQIQSLQNEARMLQNMALNLRSLDMSSLQQMVSGLDRIGGLMDEAQGIAFDVEATRNAFAQDYPAQYGAAVTNDALLADAHQRWQDAMSAYRQTLLMQAQIARNVEADGPTLAGLVAASQGAVGSLQAQQATNQLLALSVKQQLQIQSLMAAEDRAQSLDAARKAQAEEQARASFDRFMGTRTAYTPQ
jgi:P-type conjugative transfer protein TrbJ